MPTQKILNPSAEGFCVLHTGGGAGQTYVYADPNVKFFHVPEKSDYLPAYVGYMAYPNPTLKNEIPDARFYGYEGLAADSRQHLPTALGAAFSTAGKLEQSVSKAEYVKKIKAVKELLADGEIYQLNYAIRFRKKFTGSPYVLFLKLIEKNPTAFSAFLNCGDFQIISNSPERLFRVEKNRIMTQPIKGTISKAGGQKALAELMASPKERAELDMITDLERNDVGKICKYGTLRLTKERELMELSNLWHTYSEVQGDLPKNISRAEIIRAMFPGGSITGCPKIRAMEYIEKLENLPRNIFTGSIFHITGDKMDSNICIRTALVKNGFIEYWAGGGIVADSNPEAEYAECMLKAEKFLSIL